MPNSHRDTIYAMSSGTGRAGVAVVRVSGPLSSTLTEALCGSLPAFRVAKVSKLVSPDDSQMID